MEVYSVSEQTKRVDRAYEASEDSEKRVLLTAKYSVIEPLFALHLLGTIRDHGQEGTFYPIRKHDVDSVVKRAEEFGATDVGINVYAGYHNEAYELSGKLQDRGITVHIGGPHATYFSQQSAKHADFVYKGQSFDSFGAYLDGPDKIEDFTRRTTKEELVFTSVQMKAKQYKEKNGHEPSNRLYDQMTDEADAHVNSQMDSPSFKAAVSNKRSSRTFFSRFLSDTFPVPDRPRFYLDNEDMLMNPIKNAITGEGCIFACRYCYNVAWNSEDMYGRFRRRVLRDIEDVLGELESLREFNTQLIYFQDDIFGFEIKYLEKLMEGYRERVQIPFHAQLRLELAGGVAGKRRLESMAESGCTGVTVAVENGDYEVRRDVLDRAMTSEHIFEGIENILDLDLALRTEQMLGVFGPRTRKGDSVLEYDLKTLEINCLTNPTDAWDSIYQGYGGTEMGVMATKQDLLDKKELETNDGIKNSFFDETGLNYSPEYKTQAKVLQRLFRTFAHIDRGTEIAREFLVDKILNYEENEIEEFLVIATELAKVSKLTTYDNLLYKTHDEVAQGAYDSLEGCRPGTRSQSLEAIGSNDKGQEAALQYSQRNGEITLDDFEDMNLSEEQRTVFDYYRPLWEHIPKSEVIADKLLRKFPEYNPNQRESFIKISGDLHDVTLKVLSKGPLDKKARIRELIESEKERFKDEKTSCEVAA